MTYMRYVSLVPALQPEGNAKIMKEMPPPEPESSEDDLLPEYQFDYQKAKSNRFANQSGKQKLKVVVLDEDVAQVFTTSESVNKVLRALIKAMPQVAKGEIT